MTVPDVPSSPSKYLSNQEVVSRRGPCSAPYRRTSYACNQKSCVNTCLQPLDLRNLFPLMVPQLFTLWSSMASLEFAASYNSYTNLRSRMHHISAERPPLNLFRQKLAGTCIYLDVLQKSTGGQNSKTQRELGFNLPENVDVSPKYIDDELMGIAENKLVSFQCKMQFILMMIKDQTIYLSMYLNLLFL
ncbi:uncharacterized protein LOC141695119 [Apium graveolens]|uniref:uncharacterized protein LOC141695119 n=1 Tax=Apium graveolens TaxID=4045 RepID=UPI003D7ACD13